MQMQMRMQNAKCNPFQARTSEWTETQHTLRMSYGHDNHRVLENEKHTDKRAAYRLTPPLNPLLGSSGGQNAGVDRRWQTPFVTIVRDWR